MNRATTVLSGGAGSPIRGLIAIVAFVLVVMAAQLTVIRQPAGVAVIAPNHLCRWLKRNAVAFSSEQVSAVFELARRDITWR